MIENFMCTVSLKITNSFQLFWIKKLPVGKDLECLAGWRELPEKKSYCHERPKPKKKIIPIYKRKIRNKKQSSNLTTLYILQNYL